MTTMRLFNTSPGRTMLKNYIKIAIRTLKKHKVFSAINILGLAISMSVCLLILLFIVDQKSYDRFHEHSDRIYRVYSDYKAAINGSSQLYGAAPINMASLLREGYTGVETAVQIRQFGGAVEREGNEVQLSGLYADASFFEVFSFTLLLGDESTALTNPFTLVLTEEAAVRIFGAEDALGQTVMIGDDGYTVTGMLDESPGSSHLQFEALISFATLETAPQHEGLFTTWHSANRSSYTFLLIQDGIDPETIEAGFANLIQQHYPGDDEAWLEGLHLQALTDINLGMIMGNQLAFALPGVVAYFLLVLAMVIMLAACFNYMSLSVARSLTRAREVGMRKVVGAARGQIIRQFLSEAVVVALLSLGMAIVFLFWLLPSFNQLWFINFSETQISINPLQDYRVYLLFFGFSVLVGLMAGLYPALYLSRFSPVRVLKGVLRSRGRSGLKLRKVFVVMQFALSLFFFITVLLIYQQFRFMSSADFGFEPEGIVNVQLNDVRYEVLRQQMENHPDVIQVSAASLMPMEGSRSDIWMKTEGMEHSEKGYRTSIDYNFLDNMGLTLLAGRNFSPDFASDSASTVILNRKAIQRLNLGEPQQALGQTLTLFDDWSVEVIGVVEDFHTNSMIMDIDPLVLTYEPTRFRVANIRVNEGSLPIVVEHLQEAWTLIGSAHQLDYERYTVQIEKEPGMMLYQDMMHIVGLITGFAVLIACLGLLGMATYAAETRVKEVGVRKVLGANVSGIILLLSKDFLKLIGVAVVLAVPLTWGVNNLWMQQFAFRVELGPSVFILGLCVLLVLALGTIGSQAMRAALTNPVDTLRYD